MNGADIQFIADTSAVIALMRGDKRTQSQIGNAHFAVTFVTLAELNLGVLKSAKREAAWTSVRTVLRDRIMLHVSTVTPAIYARVYFELEQRGQLIPINDIWIAALALETGLPVIARDEHFSRVEGLTVINC